MVMKKGEKPNIKKKGYDDDYKLKTIMLIAANGGNISKTAKEIGMDKSTIFKWWRIKEELGYNAVNAVDRMTHDAIEEFKDEHPDFIKLVYEVKKLSLERMKVLLPKEKKLDVIARVYAAIKEEAGETTPVNHLTVFNQVNQTLISKGYGTKTSTDQGD